MNQANKSKLIRQNLGVAQYKPFKTVLDVAQDYNIAFIKASMKVTTFVKVALTLWKIILCRLVDL